MSYISDETVNRIHRRGMAIFYGAGLSCAMNIPGWEALLKKLEPERGLVERLIQIGYSLPRIATYLYLASKTHRSEFNAEVRKVLYSNDPLNKFFDGKFSDFQDGAGEFIETIEVQDPNLAALARLLVVPKYDGAMTKNPKHSPNPAIAAVVTTNYDDLLRSYIWEKFVVQSDRNTAEQRRILRTIDRPTATPRHGMLNLYHVHGFLQLCTFRELHSSCDEFREALPEAADFSRRLGRGLLAGKFVLQALAA